MTVTRRKLIEVALPLEAINVASAREKSIRHGHPSTLHLWWARRPLAAARAVIFSQMVDDPSACPEEFPTEEAQEAERQRLFRLIEQLVLWENTTNEPLLEQAREEIRKSWRRTCADNRDDPRAAELYDPAKLPAFHDPFAGGGSLPLEAQRLGLEAHASDLNPVAVLINKAMIEIPPKFAGKPPVNPESRAGTGSTTAAWKGAAGLAADVRYYGKWMRDEAEKRIGHLYPKVLITPEMVAERPDLKQYQGRELTVIAWLWARTVKSPNPAFANVHVPLASTFMLSTKPGKEAYVEPVVEGGGYRFTVKVGKPRDAELAKNGTKMSGSNFRCLMSGVVIPSAYLQQEGQAGRLGTRLLAIVVEGDRGRVYLDPTEAAERLAGSAVPVWTPESVFSQDALGFRIGNYGMANWGDLFTARQLLGLTTLADLVTKLRQRVEDDALTFGSGQDTNGIRGFDASAYADALSVYLACAVDRMADRLCSLATWQSSADFVRGTFGRPALSMIWDFAEVNPFSSSTGNFFDNIGWVAEATERAPASTAGSALQADARSANVMNVVISTDPPYYDNIGYADLSDFFYVWLRRSLGSIYTDLFSTIAVPKAAEIVATAFRHGGREQAEAFFLRGMTEAMHRLCSQSHSALPVTIYYAYKQAENNGDEDAASTGWETFLAAVIRAGFSITGTLPVRTERRARTRSLGSNALASSIVLVCRSRPANASVATKSEYLQELSLAMREALPVMTNGQIAPVDLAQASIGPGMAVYSKYSRVLRQDGKPVTIREALQDINNAISAYRTERTSSFDPKTRFCIDFYDQFGFAQAEFDNATILARAQAVGVDTLEDEHLIVAERGKAWLIPLKSYPAGVAGLERRFGGSAWEACMRLAATLQEEGEAATAALARELGEGVCARARELAVWLYTIADNRKRPQDALAFNALDVSWPEIQRLMASMDRGGQQGRFA
jgi:putative DNA methylase